MTLVDYSNPFSLHSFKIFSCFSLKYIETNIENDL